MAGLLSACAQPSSSPAPAPPPNATPPPTPQPTSPALLPTRPAPTPLPATPIPPTFSPTPVPTIAPAVAPAVAPTANAPAQADIEPPPLASLAVMIENQADARPQSGLTSADVVYEALAEGGITRFVALFLTQDAEVVGPVRSLRHYFAFLAADYGADMIHIGASPEGYAWRDAMNMGHLDETKGDPGVWRVAGRRPPHNAYTNTAVDRALLSARGRQNNHQWGPLRFDDAAPRGVDTAEQLSIAFRPWPFRATYEWDHDLERYLRAMDGVAHLDAESGSQIAPASVIVQFANVQAIPNDDKLRLDVDLVGARGDLLVFSGGTQRSGSWAKGGARSPTRWLDDAGQPLRIPPGPVWVEVVPLGSAIEVN